MSDTAIRVDGASKKYCRTINHTMLYGGIDLTSSFLGLNQRSEKLRNGEFWAVDDISFELRRGECLGLIGQNGSGKSTLLKMLNGIFMPDRGKIEISGRVGALIEVGAGFHPMLTGRENIYVNGSILGMSKKEIDRKFDEIVHFADIGDFIDAPVKHYSSGMYVRLGFAIAVNCELDILLVDEALAVGDAMFQRRCYRKIEELQKRGCTIIFVSHALETVISICSRSMLLDNGKIIKAGMPKDVVNVYSKILVEREVDYSGGAKSEAHEKEIQGDNERMQWPLQAGPSAHRFGSGGADIKELKIINSNCEPTKVLQTGKRYNFRAVIHFKKDVSETSIGINILTLSGLQIYGPNSSAANYPIAPIKADTTVVAEFEFVNNLNPGNYSVNVNVVEFLPGQRIFLDRRLDILTFEVIGTARCNGLVDMNAEIRINCV